MTTRSLEEDENNLYTLKKGKNSSWNGGFKVLAKFSFMAYEPV